MIKYLSVHIFLLFCVTTYSQPEKQTIDRSVSEKIYLQLSSTDYATDQTIWFKAIITNSENHLPSSISGVLYVELIGINGQVILRKVVKLSQGIGSGSFELDNSLESGRYLIKAYTNWSRNFEEDFMFKKYIEVFTGPGNQSIDSLAALSIIEKERGRLSLIGKLPGSNTSKQIQVFLEWGSSRDTITIKRVNNSYELDYSIPEGTQFINLTVSDEGKRRTRTILIGNPRPDLQFFPESGKMIHGIKSKLGFKSVGFDGKGIPVKANVMNSQGETVAAFSSNSLGMGAFDFKPDSSSRYHVMATFPTRDDSIFKYSLPEIFSKGSVLSIGTKEGKVSIKVASNELQGKVYIKVGCRGEDYFLIEGPLVRGQLNSELASATLPEGIISLTLMDSAKKLIAERLYFNRTDTEELEIGVNTDKDIYDRREKTELEISVTGKGHIQIPSNVSVLVLNREHLDNDMGNIRSYFLLDSELRGTVENPGYYFRCENNNRDEDIDALLLTQGWRNYRYPIKTNDRKFFWPQEGLTIKGTVRSASRKKTLESKVNVTLLTFGTNSTVYTQQTDTMGRFRFLLDDTYQNRMRTLLTAANSEDNTNDYNVSLDLIPKLEVNYEIEPLIQNISPIRMALVKAKERRDRTNAVFDSLYGVTQLDEVIVEGYQLTPEREEAYKKFGEPYLIIKGDIIREKEKKWSFGLYSILMFNYGDQVKVEQFPDGFMLANIRGGSREPTLLSIDGRLITKEQYNLVPGMPPGIVESVELIKYAKNFKYQYLKVFPETDVLEAPSLGHIISIYTKNGVGIFATDRKLPGTLDHKMETFTAVTEFYEPKYDKPVPADKEITDLRSLIHWAPSSDNTENPVITESFYNGDVAGEYVIIVEAISKDGRIGYKEYKYSIRN